MKAEVRTLVLGLLGDRLKTVLDDITYSVVQHH